jgi:hypothetical protein
VDEKLKPSGSSICLSTPKKRPVENFSSSGQLLWKSKMLTTSFEFEDHLQHSTASEGIFLSLADRTAYRNKKKSTARILR